MLIRNAYTEAKRASAGNSTDKIDLGRYDGLIITSSLTGVVTAYMSTEADITETTIPFTTGLEFPASTAAGTYNIQIAAIKCATAADAKKIIVFR
mgnify:FL=1